LASAEADRLAGMTPREFAVAALNDLPSWYTLGRAIRARRALQEPVSRRMGETVAELKVLDIADRLAAMTARERIRLRREMMAWLRRLLQADLEDRTPVRKDLLVGAGVISEHEKRAIDRVRASLVG